MLKEEEELLLKGLKSLIKQMGRYDITQEMARQAESLVAGLESPYRHEDFLLEQNLFPKVLHTEKEAA